MLAKATLKRGLTVSATTSIVAFPIVLAVGGTDEHGLFT
jgi:hypothetical protein